MFELFRPNSPTGIQELPALAVPGLGPIIGSNFQFFSFLIFGLGLSQLGTSKNSSGWFVLVQRPDRTKPPDLKLIGFGPFTPDFYRL